jgi:hypothetical protein
VEEDEELRCQRVERKGIVETAEVVLNTVKELSDYEAGVEVPARGEVVWYR